MGNNVVKRKRVELGVTQEEIADSVGISRQYYNSIENFRKRPSVKIAKGVATALQLEEWNIFFPDEVNV